MDEKAIMWLTIGLIMAGELIFSVALAVLVRMIANLKLVGQTYWMVVAGVAGTLVIAGAQIGFENVAFLAACFGLTGLVMGVEYFTRLAKEHKDAQRAREESIK
jgi:hypothetical protein